MPVELSIRKLLRRLTAVVAGKPPQFSFPSNRQVPRGMQSISDVEGADVFIAGYPKSGNTWFQSLIGGAIYGFDPEWAPDRLLQDLVPDVHDKQCYKRYRTPMLFKTHSLPRPEYRNVVYLL